MSCRIIVAIIFLGVVLAAAQEESVYRSSRTFGLLDFIFGGRQCGEPGDCPPHHCSRDDAVLYGWCCGCAHWNDHVPLRCPPDLVCPPDFAALCHDYNYMMDCCC